MGGKRNSIEIRLELGVPLTRTIFQLLGKAEDDELQIATRVEDQAGNIITPNSGTLRISIIPRGSTIFLAGDKDLDLVEGEFYRPFRVLIDGVRFEVMTLDPSDATVIAIFTAV